MSPQPADYEAVFWTAVSRRFPDWVDRDLYWQGWWQGRYVDKAHPLATDTELLRLISEHDSWALGVRDGMAGRERE